MVGYKPVNGSSDPECTHVILTLDEYDELHQRIRAAIMMANVQKMKLHVRLQRLRRMQRKQLRKFRMRRHRK